MSAYQLDFAAGGCAGLVRLELRDTIAWYWTYLVGVPGIDGIVVVRDHEVPLPRRALEIRAEGLWAELFCETPGEHWTFGLEAFGLRLDTVADALPQRDEIGERVPAGLDLEWEVGDLVHGDVLVGRIRHTIDGTGTFDEGNGPPADAAFEEWIAGVG